MPLIKAGDASWHQPGTTSLRASISALPRRVNHGGAAWLKRRGEELRQPQDGAPKAPAVEPAKGPKSVEQAMRAVEGDDAQMTGGTRCLMRRLMGLNITSVGAQLEQISSPHKLLPRRAITV